MIKKVTSIQYEVPNDELLKLLNLEGQINYIRIMQDINQNSPNYKKQTGIVLELRKDEKI